MLSLQAFFGLDEKLSRSIKTNPQFSLCCLGGKIRLPRPLSTPHVLDELLDPAFGEASKKFRTNIRAYNSMFAFTSMGANIDHSVNRQPGPNVFKINGHCHHLMGSLLPSDGETPKFAQLYIYDTTNEVANRLAPFPHGSSASTLDESVVKDLIDMLNSTNCLIGLFVMLRKGCQCLTILDINYGCLVKELMTQDSIMTHLQMILVA
jgi:hypothetical protein